MPFVLCSIIIKILIPIMNNLLYPLARSLIPLLPNTKE